MAVVQSSGRKAKSFTIESLMGRVRDESRDSEEEGEKDPRNGERETLLRERREREGEERLREAEMSSPRPPSHSRSTPSPSPGNSPQPLPGPPTIETLRRAGFHLPPGHHPHHPGGMGFQPVIPGATAAMAALLQAGLKPPHLDHAGGPTPFSLEHLHHNGHLLGLHPGAHPGGLGPLPAHHPLLMGGSGPAAHRDTFPLYPLLMSRHGSFFGHRFAGGDPTLLLQPFRKPKRIRTAFSPSQLLRLEHAFEKNHYVVGQERKDLAQNLSLTETQVKVWFQNRRTKFKRVAAEEDEEQEPSQTPKQPSPSQGHKGHTEVTTDASAPQSPSSGSESKDKAEISRKRDNSESDKGPVSPKRCKPSHHLSRWRVETNQV